MFRKIISLIPGSVVGVMRFRSMLAVIAVVLLPADVAEASCSLPHTFADGTSAIASQVNDNFTAVAVTCVATLAPIASPSFTGTATFAGSVGIGTTTPAYEVDINGAAPFLALDRSTGASSNAIVLEQSGTAYGYVGLVGNQGGLVIGAVSGDTAIRTQGGAILLSTNSGASAAVYIAGTSGNVGIGTTTPTHTLEVTGTINSSGTITQAGSALLVASNNLSDVANSTSAKSNLGIKTTTVNLGTPAAGGTYSVSTGTFGLPTHFYAYIQCVTAEHGYAVGDRVIVTQGGNSRNDGATVWANSTTMGVTIGANGIWVMDRSTYTGAIITPGNWYMYGVLTTQ